ncbi:Cyclin-dependent protein kinase inhibitor SMR3, partial [Cucurbita argyrosperma subsp. sororia]
MASQFREISLTPESFRVKLEDADQIEFIFAVENRPLTSESQQRCDSSAPEESLLISAVDDEDGCRTPTSSDYKIPLVEHCPPAPRRPKPMSLSRTSPRVSGVRRGFRVYISDEIVDSIFSSSFGSDFLQHKNKKSRKDDHGESNFSSSFDSDLLHQKTESSEKADHGGETKSC